MIKLILHNVFKHKFLFILIGIMLVVLCFYLIVGMNAVFSVSKSLKQAVADNMTGDLIITSRKATRIDIMTKDGEKNIIPLEKWQELLQFVQSQDYVETVSPRLRIRGYLQSVDNILPVIITGVDPVSEPKLLPHRIINDGRWLSKSNEINLYYRHSDYLNVNKNDILGIMINTIDGYSNFDTAKVVGILDYEDLDFYMEYSYFGFVDIDYLNSLLMTKEKTVGELFITLKDKKAVDRLQKAIVGNFGDTYRFIRPENSGSLISGIYKLTYFIVYFVAFLLLIMVFLCSSFLVSLSIETRRQEIGIYQALGVKKWRIGLLFGGEFLVVMFLFGFIGTLLGMYFMQGISHNGIEASIIPLRLIFGRSILFIQNHFESYLIVLLILLVAFIGNVSNAISKLSKLDPVEVMREL